jgi:DNA repair exonuclease SbcCD ATPase subunit/DNA-directed RNA polymerase subunit RPC12/RpoP
MILIQSLKLNNFLSHSSTSIDFEKNCKIAITGISGSGKSSLVEAIIFAFYGKGRVDNRFLIKKSKKACSVLLTFTDDNLTYRIERGVDSKGKNSLEIHIKDGDKAYKPLQISGLKTTQEYLEKQILHCSYTLFVNSVVSPQANNESFTDLPASARKDLLLQIVNINDLDTYLKQTKEKLSEFEQEKSNNESNSVIINQSLIADRQVAANLPTLEIQEQEIKAKLEIVNTNLKSITSQLANIDFKITSKAEKERELNITKQSIQIIDIEINTFKNEIKKIDEMDITAMQAEVGDISSLKAELNGLKVVETIGNEWNVKMLDIMKDKPVTRDFDKEIAEINKQLIELMTYPQEQCPQCGHKFAPKTVDSTSKRLERVLADTNQARIDYNKGLEEYEIKVKALGERPAVDSSKIRALEVDIYNKEQKLVNINNIINTRDLRKTTFQEKITAKEAEKVEKEGKITVLIAEIQALMVEIMGSEDIKKQEMELNGEKFKIEMELRLVVEGASLAKNAVLRAVSSEESLKRIEGSANDLDIKIEALELLKMALSPNGVKAMVIDYLVPELEDKINKVLSKLSDLKIHIDTQRSSADGEKLVEGLFLNIINDQNEEMELSNFSGGEKCKILTAIHEGLGGLQRFGWRILDESITGLDSEMVSSFAEVILKLKEETQQLLVISHLQEIKDIFEERIEVTKLNGNSSVIVI